MNANCPVAGRAVAEPDSEAAVRFWICRHCTWEMEDRRLRRWRCQDLLL